MRGGQRNAKIRLYNRIVANMAVLLSIATTRGVWWALEQPVSSWMFKQDLMVDLVELAGARRATTWMGQCGHVMPKCTHLLGALPTLPQLSRDVAARLPLGR